MSGEGQTDAIEALWFLYSEDARPMGRTYRREGQPTPQVGLRFRQGDDDSEVEIVEFRELGPTCLMRRFHVVVRAAERAESQRDQMSN